MEWLSVLRRNLQENSPASTDGRCPCPRRSSGTQLNTRATAQCRSRLLPGVHRREPVVQRILLAEDVPAELAPPVESLDFDVRFLALAREAQPPHGEEPADRR